MNLKYLDLPAVPADVIEDIFNTINTELLKQVPGAEYPTWQSFRVSKKVKDFVYSIFDPTHDVVVFYLTRGLPIHKDVTRDTGYNFVLETGGDSITYFYDNNHKEINYFLNFF